MPAVQGEAEELYPVCQAQPINALEHSTRLARFATFYTIWRRPATPPNTPTGHLAIQTIGSIICRGEQEPPQGEYLHGVSV